MMRPADIAQSVEHLIGNEEVISSNLIISSKSPRQSPRVFCVKNRERIFRNLLTNTLKSGIICKEFAERPLLIANKIFQ